MRGYYLLLQSSQFGFIFASEWHPELFRALGSCLHLRCEVVVGGMNKLSQARNLVGRPHVVIATPGRIKVLLEEDPDIPPVFSKTKIAREMVISLQNARLGLAALTKRVGLLDRPDNSDGELIKYRWDNPHVIPANMTLELSELFSLELTRYIEETEELAMNALKENRHILDIIAKELLEKLRITGLEGPLPHNDSVRYQPLDIYPAPLHRS
ncbi:hypothetical protein LWI29_009979 [Acer saccharum]|uniref:Uncharacterized protein n=1 Tax=Acer saccharum TaxID=4024 RepID=A0AA39SSA3_ACESA|nr:hypothetical protein LWI29_009979 [Acer saccharum]